MPLGTHEVFPTPTYVPENLLCFSTVLSGGFPQEIVLQLKSAVKVAKIQLSTTNVRKVIVERCELDQPTKFDKVSEMGAFNPRCELQLA